MAARRASDATVAVTPDLWNSADTAGVRGCRLRLRHCVARFCRTGGIGARDGRRRALRLPPPPPRPRAFTDRRSRSYEARRRRARARRAAAPAAAERAPRGAPPDRYHRQLPIRNAAPGFRAYRGIEPTLRNQIPFCRSAAEPARLRRARFGALRHPARPGPSQLGHISVARLRPAGGGHHQISARALCLTVAV